MLSEEAKRDICAEFAGVVKERLGKGPGSVTLESCGGVLMVVMHRTITPFERTLAQAADGWSEVVDARDKTMKVVTGDFVEVLQQRGLRVREVFCEVDIESDCQVIVFRESA
jgi:uncharacterized protein YbcI